MADLQHSTLPHSAVHEPKHIGINGPSASGRVITNSSSTTGQSEYRRLRAGDIDEIPVELAVLEINASVAQTHYIPATFQGTIEKFTAIVNSAITTAANSYELRIDGVAVTGSSLSLTTTAGSGGTAGDIVSAVPSAANDFSVDQVITIVNTAAGNTDSGVNVRFVLSMVRG
jgi:hypothetical protein